MKRSLYIIIFMAFLAGGCPRTSPEMRMAKPGFVIMGVSEDPIVSTDVIGDDRPSIIDLSGTRVVDGRFLKVMAFYDNEWGYANQLLRVAVAL